MRQLVVGIIGEKSSGKSAVFEYLKTKRGFFSARTSDYLRDIIKLLHLDLEYRPNYSNLGQALRATYGPDILPRAILADPKVKKSRVVVIEGIRRLAELKMLRRRSNFRLMYVTAPVELRWQRAKLRTKAKRDDDHISLAAYKKIEREVITEKEIPRMGKLADIRINNIGSRTDLFTQVDRALKKFGVTL